MRAWLLVLACLAVSARAVAQSERTDGLERWSEGWDDDSLRLKYEELFDHPLPTRPLEWFHRVHPFYEVQAMDHAVALREAGISYRVDEADSGVTVSVYWPGSAQQPLDVSVRDGVVHMRPSPAAPQANSPYRFRATGAPPLDIPVPRSADQGKPAVTREGDVVRVAFPRK